LKGWGARAGARINGRGTSKKSSEVREKKEIKSGSSVEGETSAKGDGQ